MVLETLLILYGIDRVLKSRNSREADNQRSQEETAWREQCRHYETLNEIAGWEKYYIRHHWWRGAEWWRRSDSQRPQLAS